MIKTLHILIGVLVLVATHHDQAKTEESTRLTVTVAKPSLLHWDTSLGISSRSYPLGGTLNARGGVSLLLWKTGDPIAPNQTPSPLFGYIRFGVQGASSGNFNSASGEIALYPVAPIELAVGKYFQSMGSDFDGFDCESSQCKGELQNSYLRASLVLGYRDWFALTRGVWSRWDDSTNKKTFVEIESAILGASEREVQATSTFVLGKKISSLFTVGFLYSQSRMQVSTQTQNQWSGFGSYTLGDWKYSLGMGRFSSSEKNPNPLIFGKLSYDLKSSIGFY